MNIEYIYTKYGEVAHWASLLEEQLCIICIINEAVINQDKYKNDRAALKTAALAFDKKTIGALIAEIKKVLGKGYEQQVDKILGPALIARNKLIHNFFITHCELAKNPTSDKYKAALHDIDSIREVMIPAVKLATNLCSSLFSEINPKQGDS